MLNEGDLKALQRFIEKYPTWWYTIGVCDRSRDFTCAPQGHSPEFRFAAPGNEFDTGFMCDHTGSVADAIEQVTAEVEVAIKRAFLAVELRDPAPAQAQSTPQTGEQK